PDLLLELRELVGVGISRERMAHGAGRPGPGHLHIQLLLRAVVPMEEEVADPYLIQEYFLECLELLRGVLVLVRASGGDDQNRAEDGARRDETLSHRLHGCLLPVRLTCKRRSKAIPGPRGGDGRSG